VEPARNLFGLGLQLVAREVAIARPEDDTAPSLEQLNGKDPRPEAAADRVDVLPRADRTPGHAQTMHMRAEARKLHT